MPVSGCFQAPAPKDTPLEVTELTMPIGLPYDQDLVLDAPSGGIFDTVRVAIEFDPPTAGCTIFGWDEEGGTTQITVTGSAPSVDLPFCQPQIFVKFLPGLKSVRIRTLDWHEAQ